MSNGGIKTATKVNFTIVISSTLHVHSSFSFNLMYNAFELGYSFNPMKIFLFSNLLSFWQPFVVLLLTTFDECFIFSDQLRDVCDFFNTYQKVSQLQRCCYKHIKCYSKFIRRFCFVQNECHRCDDHLNYGQDKKYVFLIEWRNRRNFFIILRI